jgi:protein-S-isoprenylcysteine O-methyltransferase Ste14
MVFGNPLACYYFTRAPRLVALITLLYSIVLVVRVHDEEIGLENHFKDAFRKYKAERWRLVPFVY